MDKKINFTRKEFLTVALMLFAMFFGAGNFILPPMLGKAAGENFYLAMMFFCFTGVALPVLGVAAVARAGTLKDLASRANPVFATIFVAVIYISIGPLLAIPRASNMPYDIMIMPYFNNDYSLLIYTFIYFAINYYVCLNPHTIVDALGRILTPILLILILVFFLGTVLIAEPNIAQASGGYVKNPISTAFIEGYQTMDALAALVFGISVVGALKGYGITNKAKLSTITIKTGLFSGIILMVVYMLLGYIGYVYGNTYANAENGAILLSSISNDLFGNLGRLILGITALLACLTTTIGLIGSAASYFSSITKIAYKHWVLLWVLGSFLIANLGLTQIIKISIPVLIAIYPIAIVLIFLSLANKVLESSKIIYSGVIYTAGLIGVLNALDIAGIYFDISGEKRALLDVISGGFVPKFLNILPFYSSMLGWIVPVVIVFIITCTIHYLRKKDY